MLVVFVVWRVMIVARRVLLAVCLCCALFNCTCSSFVVPCLWCVVCRLLCDGCCLLFVVCHDWCVARCLLFVAM